MQLTKVQFAIIGSILAFVTIIILLFTGVIPGLRSKTTGNLAGNLTIWGVFDTEKTMNESLITSFVTANPAVRITYRQMNPATYELDLINALAAGTGPDIFMLKNTWLSKHANKISPLPADRLPINGLGAIFPDVVIRDFVANNTIYALPLYIDTLAMFYNKTIFDNLAIAQPPVTWSEFQELVPRLRSAKSDGTIVRPAAAIGGSDRNINGATDLLNLIMMQSGVPILAEDGSRAIFSNSAGPAVEFYTDFANPRSPYYTWDPSQHYSLDSFAEEAAPIIFTYAFQTPLLKEKNPFLNFATAPMLQMKGAAKHVNYANYFGLTVASTSKQKDLAWAFIMNSTLNTSANINYLNAANRPPALREVIAVSVNDPDIGLFSRQALTAASWQKIDDAAIDATFTRMIELINNGQLQIGVALKQAEEEITSLMQRSLPR